MQIRKLAAAIGAVLFTTGLAAVSGAASANADLVRMAEDDKNWVMQTKDYSATHFSKMGQINADNVKYLKVA
jgi:methanol dehydrogenase (cytochrome c) subunit 1